MKQGVCILGATGSIGTSTLDIIRRHPDKFELVAVSAYHNVEKMRAICEQFTPKVAVMVDNAAAEKLAKLTATTVLSGKENLISITQRADVALVMAAIVGAAALPATLAAVKSNKKVLLANKEALVMSGQIFMNALAHSSATLLPVDSEHNAIFQCMPDGYKIGTQPVGVKKILLTGSGGPFLHEDPALLAAKTPQQAINHPNWSMGPKISVDSATMINKGLEWIEARWLFALDSNNIEIIIHPQSIIHSMVEYDDGSTLAQLGRSDMRVPIANVMGLPHRVDSGVKGLDFLQTGTLEFQPADEGRFPCLRLAREAWEAGGSATTTLNAANEVAVADFLEDGIKFTQIAEVVEQTLASISNQATEDMADILTADSLARQTAKEQINKL